MYEAGASGLTPVFVFVMRNAAESLLKKMFSVQRVSVYTVALRFAEERALKFIVSYVTISSR